jgi:hypothetical protein
LRYGHSDSTSSTSCAEARAYTFGDFEVRALGLYVVYVVCGGANALYTHTYVPRTGVVVRSTVRTVVGTVYGFTSNLQ